MRSSGDWPPKSGSRFGDLSQRMPVASSEKSRRSAF